MFSKIKNYITENTGILIRLDDISENMNWNLMIKRYKTVKKRPKEPEDDKIYLELKICRSY